MRSSTAFTDIFIRRPVLAICVNLLVLVLGIQAYLALSVRQYPRTDNSSVVVKTVYVGADADLVRGYITTPLERVIASADGIDYLESQSVQGMSTITARLKLNFDVNAALTQIQAKVAQVRNELPPEAEAPTIDVVSADTEIASLYISFSSDSMEQNQITDYLLRVVQPQLSSLPGVQKADILGARILAMRVWLQPERMSAYGISPEDVANALRNNNFLAAVGSTKGSTVTINLTSNSDLKTREEFERLVVKDIQGSLVRLGDIANVVLGAESYDDEVRFGGKKATFIGVWSLPNANVLDTVRHVREALPLLESKLPAGLTMYVAYDATNYVRSALREVISTLLETIAIVIVVIYLFLGSLRSVIIPIVAIPLSLIGAVAMMAVFGFTINLLTLLAIVLSVGLVVDDAIVMLENIERYMREGLSGIEAALKGARQLVAPTIAMTLTLATVYAPIGFQGGLTGTLFKEFALTLAGAVVVSGFVALTLSPVMSAYLLRHQQRSTSLADKVQQLLLALQSKYLACVHWALDNRPLVMTLAIGASVLVIPFAMFSAKELAPAEDMGVTFGIVQTSPSATIDQTTTFTEKFQEIYQRQPEYRQSFQITNPTGGFSGMLLKPWDERARSSQEIAKSIFGEALAVPGVRIISVTPPALPGGSNLPIEFIISSTADPSEIAQFSQQLVGAAFASQKYMFADSDLKFDLPKGEILFDRDKLASMGLTLAQVSRELGTLTGGNYVNRFSIQGRSYKVIPLIERRARLTLEQMLDLYVTGKDHVPIQLRTIASVKRSVQPRSLNRFQQLNSAAITGAIPPGISVDQALQVLENKAREILPPGYTVDYRGESRQLRKEGSALLKTFVVALVLIFLVLASQFESFRDPFIILLGSVPLALSGALVFVFLGCTSMNIYSQVGLVTLVGLIAKNGILLVEFANHLRDQGIAVRDAILESCKVRLRPVLMTSVATIAGHFPLILAHGPGAGARNSIGIVLVSGMFLGTLFALLAVPVIYSYVAREATPKKEH